MLMVKCTKVNVKTIKPKEKVFTSTPMELNIMESGWKIYNKAEESKLGKTELNMMDFIKKEKKMVRVYLPGLMEANMKEIFLIIIKKEAVFINGQTEEDTKDSGSTIKCMAKDC